MYLQSDDMRNEAFKTCIRFINYELVCGDICEFGVYTGRSLALLSFHNDDYFNNENVINKQYIQPRICYGFDSWEGLPVDRDNHPRWIKGLFKTNHSYHPTIQSNSIVTPDNVVDYFITAGLQIPKLIKSDYDNLKLPESINSIALVHIDCDLYESTKKVLYLIKSKLVQGSIIMFDDWHNYKSHSGKGEQRAYNEFLQENPTITSTDFLRYATFCKAFVITSV
tara:strand:+ start:913 stop:1584 length:672 start_codon:yes stop_codon:yes gene_type:complete